MSKFDRNISYRPSIPKWALNEVPSQLLDKWANLWPEKLAYVFRESEDTREFITFGDLKIAVECLAVWFIRLGLVKGDRVGILSLNRLNYVLTDLALNRLGAVSVRLYATMDSRQELTRSLTVTKCRYLVTQNQSLMSVRELVPGLDQHDPRTRLSVETIPDLERIIYFPGQESCPGATEFPDFMSITPTEEELELLNEIQKTQSLDDDSTIYSTSGSTGIPKYVAYSTESHLRFMTGFLRRAGVTSNDVFFTDRPMAHLGGSTAPAVVFGLTQVVANPWKTVKKGDRQYLSRVFHEEQVSFGVCFPYFLYDLVMQEGDLSDLRKHLRCILYGGQIANYEIIKSVKDKLGIPMINGYGATEVGEIACSNPSDPFEFVAKGPGQVLDAEVKLVDHEGQVVPVGHDGEICVRVDRKWRYLDDSLMAATHDNDGFFRSGDMGKMDVEGRLEVLARKDDVINVATAKVYPGPIEQKLCEHPKIDKCQVFGVPDLRLGETVGAVIMPKLGCQITPDDVINYFNQSVNDSDLMTGSHVTPKHVWIEDAFPLTSSGKVDKKTLKTRCLEKLNGAS